MRLLAPLSTAVEKRSERFSLCSGFGAGDLVVGVVPRESGFVNNGVVVVEEHFDDDTKETTNSGMNSQSV